MYFSQHVPATMISPKITFPFAIFHIHAKTHPWIHVKNTSLYADVKFLWRRWGWLISVYSKIIFHFFFIDINPQNLFLYWARVKQKLKKYSIKLYLKI